MSKIEKLIADLNAKAEELITEYYKLTSQINDNKKASERTEKEMQYLRRVKTLDNLPEWQEEIHTNNTVRWSERITYKLNTPKHSITIYISDRIGYKRDKYQVEIFAQDIEWRSRFMGKSFNKIEKVFKTKADAIKFANEQKMEFDKLLESHLQEIKELLEIKNNKTSA